jgi:hypothetical protein
MCCVVVWFNLVWFGSVHETELLSFLSILCPHVIHCFISLNHLLLRNNIMSQITRTYLKMLYFPYKFYRVSHKKKQCEILQSYKSQREVNILLCIFKEWLSLSLIGKYKREVIAIEVQKRGEKNSTRKLFFMLQGVAETKVLKAGTYYRIKTMQMHWHVWREKRTIKILEKGLGSLFGMRKIYLQRSFECWIEVYRMKRRMTYAVQLLQVTVDRAKARRALGAWPGWKEYRRSEVMRKQIMLKRDMGEECGEGDDEGDGEGMEERKGDEEDSMQSQYTMQKKSQKQKMNSTHTPSWKKEHSPPLPPLPLPLSLPLSLAERLAMVVKDTLRNSSQASYSSALSSARNLLHTRTSILSSRSFSSMKVYGDIPSHSESYGYSANPYRDDSDNPSSSDDCNSNGNSSSSNDSDTEGRIRSSGMTVTDHLGFFIGSLRGTTSCSAEDRAVKELLLLMQIVLLAWSKATKSSSSMRAKIRRIKHMVNKVRKLYALIHN